MSNYKEPAHEQIHQPGSEGACPSEGGQSSVSAPAWSKTPAPESFGGGVPGSMPNGDNSNPAVGSVELPSQGDQRNYAEQSRMSVPGDNRITEGGKHSNPTEEMPGA